MSPQIETDSAFQIQVLTSVNFPDWLAKKPRRSPKARKIPGKSSGGRVRNRGTGWADKFHRPQQAKAKVPAMAKVKSGTKGAGIRGPIQYDTWLLIWDREFLFWDYLVRVSASARNCCGDLSKHSEDRIAAAGFQLQPPPPPPPPPPPSPATEADIGYITQPPQNLIPTSSAASPVYAPPDIAPTVFNNVPIHEAGIYDRNYEFPELKQESPWAWGDSQDSASYGPFQWSPEYFCDDSCYPRCGV